MPWGQMNMPPPKLSTVLPSESNLMTGSRSESRHSLPKRSAPASHLTMAQTCSPSLSIVTSPTAPICLPAGSLAQPSTVRKGLAPAWAVSPSARVTISTAATIASSPLWRMGDTRVFDMSLTSIRSCIDGPNS